MHQLYSNYYTEIISRRFSIGTRFLVKNSLTDTTTTTNKKKHSHIIIKENLKIVKVNI